MAELHSLTGLAAQIAVGGGMFYGVQKFFKEVEEKLTAEAKLDIGLWLAEPRLLHGAQNLLSTFADLLDKVFGAQHVTWKCFTRSCLASVSTSVLVYIAVFATASSWRAITVRQQVSGLTRSSLHISDLEVIPIALATLFLVNLIPDYMSLYSTRMLLALTRTTQSILRIGLVLLIDMMLTLMIACGPAYVIYNALWLGASESLRTMYTDTAKLSPEEGEKHIREFEGILAKSGFSRKMLDDLSGVMRSGYQHREDLYRQHVQDFLVETGYHELLDVTIIPSCFTSIWLWLYALAVFLVRLAHRFDGLIALFTRYLDIKNHPLQCVGLISGAAVAIMFWIVAAVRGSGAPSV